MTRNQEAIRDQRYTQTNHDYIRNKQSSSATVKLESEIGEASPSHRSDGRPNADDHSAVPNLLRGDRRIGFLEERRLECGHQVDGAEHNRRSECDRSDRSIQQVIQRIPEADLRRQGSS